MISSSGIVKSSAFCERFFFWGVLVLASIYGWVSVPESQTCKSVVNQLGTRVTDESRGKERRVEEQRKIGSLNGCKHTITTKTRASARLLPHCEKG